MADDREDLIRNPPFELSRADLEVMRQTDAEFVPHTWDELRAVIATKDTANLRRTPTGLANYIRWIRYMREHRSSISEYILRERLRWIDSDTDSSTSSPSNLAPISPTIFANPSDYAIRRNDWPYGCAAGIVHLVIWLKGRIRVDEDVEKGDPLPEEEQRINDFVERQFARPLGCRPRPHSQTQNPPGPGQTQIEEEDRTPAQSTETQTQTQIGWITDDGSMEVMWFRNRTRWQSVRALEHIHVLLRYVPEAQITEWTGGQRARDIIAERWARGERGAELGGAPDSNK